MTVPSAESPRVIVVGPDGRPLQAVPAPEEQAAPTAGMSAAEDLRNLVEQPAKVMRIGTMIKQLLEEVRAAPLDEEGRARLREIHEASIRELEQAVAPELASELARITLPFTEDETPTESELRIAQAQLVGWLEGLFQGIQTALFAQQMTARAQFEEMRRRALPGGAGLPGGPGSPGGPGDPGQPGAADPTRPGSPTGQYL